MYDRNKDIVNILLRAYAIKNKETVTGLVGVHTDITRFKKMEEDTRASALRFRELFMNMSSGVAVYRVSADGNHFILSDFNRSAERIENIQKEALIDKDVLDVFPGIKEFGLYDVFKRVWATGEPEFFPISFYADSRIQGWRDNFIYKLPTGEIVAVYDDVTKRMQAEEALKSTLNEKETLLRELYHRTKNNMQVICSMLTMQSSRSNNEEVKNLFHEMTNRINAMTLVHQKLYQSKNLSCIDFKEYVQELTTYLVDSFVGMRQDVSIVLDVENIPVVIDVAISCGLVLNELISNCFKHAFSYGARGEIRIQVKRSIEGIIDLSVCDNGVGVPADFDIKKIKSLGLRTVKTIVEHQLQGSFACESRNGLCLSVVFDERVYGERV